ncbi:MAG: hypothetical protein Q8Q89_03975 [bacterium]|nr:hypothetical protein [bacterium]
MEATRGKLKKQYVAPDINKIRESHIGYLLLSDDEIKLKVEGTAATGLPELGELLIFGPNDWKRYLGVELTAQQLKNLPRFPWDASVLESPCPFNPGKLIKETHFAFLGLNEINRRRSSIHQLKKGQLLKGKLSLRISYYYDYNIPKCYRKALEFRWYLMPKNLEVLQEARTFTVAKEAIPEEYEAATAVEAVFKNALLYCKCLAIEGAVEIGNPALVNDRVQDAGSLIVKMSSGNKITVSMLGYRFKEKRDSYGDFVSRTRVEKSTNLPIAVSRKLKK